MSPVLRQAARNAHTAAGHHNCPTSFTKSITTPLLCLACRMHASSPSPFIEARSLLDLSSEENFVPPPPPYKLPPKLHIKTGSDPVLLPVGPTLQPALSRRLSTAGILSLPAIDELEPLLFESPGPVLQQPLSAKQVSAGMACGCWYGSAWARISSSSPCSCWRPGACSVAAACWGGEHGAEHACKSR